MTNRTWRWVRAVWIVTKRKLSTMPSQRWRMTLSNDLELVVSTRQPDTVLQGRFTRVGTCWNRDDARQFRLMRKLLF